MHKAKGIITGCNCVLIKLAQRFKALGFLLFVFEITIHEGEKLHNERLGEGAAHFLSRKMWSGLIFMMGKTVGKG